MKHPESAKRLQEELNREGIKPVELSEKTGVSQASISQYLRGSHAPSNGNADAMAKFFGCDPLWIMGFDVPREKTKSPIETPEDSARKVWDLALDEDMIQMLSIYANLPPEKKKRAVEALRLFCTE